MKYLVASDIHGSLHFASELEKRIERRNRFLEILEKCKNRIIKYINVA